MKFAEQCLANRNHQEQLTLDAVQDVVSFVEHEVEADLAGHGVRSTALLHPLEDLHTVQANQLSAAHLQLAVLWWHQYHELRRLMVQT